MKTGVVLLTLGGPRSLEEVPAFIRHFIGRELPPRAMEAVIERYRLIGGFSPLASITEDQAKKLQEVLGDEYFCIAAFRHCRPFIEEAIDVMVSSNVNRITFLLLSPFYTSVTTGDYIEKAREKLEAQSVPLPVAYIHSWYEEPLFIRSWVEKIQHESFEEKAHYLFSAHSLPLRYCAEPYHNQIVETVDAVASQAGIEHYTLGWQSIPTNVSEPWIIPTVEERIDEIKAKGFRSIVQVPIGFTADHIETLYDIDITHRQYAMEKGLSFRRISSFNASDSFITALRHIVMKYGVDTQ